MTEQRITEAEALAQIADLLDGQDWSSSTIETVAEIMRDAGYLIRDPDEMPD